MDSSTEGKDSRLITPSKPTWRRDALEWASETIENGASASISPETAYALARTLLAMQEQIDGCGKYTKDGETIAEAMERHWQDSQNALGFFAKERLKKEEVLSALRALYDAFPDCEGGAAGKACLLARKVLKEHGK